MPRKKKEQPKEPELIVQAVPVIRPDKQIIRYSNSALNDMRSCPAKLYWKDLAKRGLIQEDIVLPLVYGSGIHLGIEESIKTNADPHAVAKDYLQKNLFEKLEDVKLATDEKIELQEKIKEREDITTKCLSNFQRDIRPKVVKALEGHDLKECIELWVQTPWRKGLLVGKLDVRVPGRFTGDWKSSKTPSPGNHKYIKDFTDSLKRDTQKAIYSKIGKDLGMEGLDKFKYVYLQGIPTKQVQEIDEKTGKPAVYKSGPRKDEPKMTWDLTNGLMYDFNFDQTEEEVDRIFNEQIEPLAELYENGVIYKNFGYNMQTCKGCRYKTACWKEDRPLPQRAAYQITENDAGDSTDE